jgi:penicillin-binding protein 1C
MLAALLCSSARAEVPAFARVRADYAPSEAVLLDRHGERIQETRVDPTGRRLEWTPLAAVSPALVSAVLEAEDRRFYEHDGVDWRALASAFWDTVARRHPRGASTIAMQLAGLLDRHLAPARGGTGRSLAQKWAQLRLARELGSSWTHEQILEAYLNLVTFRGELQGVASAARGVFGKDPHGLEDEEARILAALIRSPEASAEKVARRACALDPVTADCAGLERRVLAAFARPRAIPPRVALAPQLATRLVARLGGARGGELRTTLDSGLQRFARETLRRQLLGLREQNVRDGAILVLDNASGEVLAYVGSSEELSSAPLVDGVLARRQAGSTLKPFLYARAFDRRLLTPGSTLEDSPLDVPTDGGIYRPENYDRRFHGPVPARVALASSLNVPAVRTLGLVGVDDFVRTLGQLGVSGLRESGFYGSSLALGSADLSLWELTNAYRSLARGGRWSEAKLLAGESVPSRRAFSPEAAFLVSDILSDRENRSLTFGLESSLSTRYWSAAKTGTSKDMRDNWCLGYSSRYTVGVWVGNFSGAPMWNVTGIEGAAPVWLEVMNRLHSRGEPSRAPKAPRGIAWADGRAYLKGTEPVAAIAGTARAPSQSALQSSLPSQSSAAARILFPAPGTFIALDPDIPPGRQAVFLEASRRDARLSWRLDGEPLGDAADVRFWPPRAGSHELALLRDGEAIDHVSFVVRGGGRRAD